MQNQFYQSGGIRVGLRLSVETNNFTVLGGGFGSRWGVKFAVSMDRSGGLKNTQRKKAQKIGKPVYRHKVLVSV